MDQYEKAIREKVFAANVLTPGEWVYLVGMFGIINELSDEDAAIKEPASAYSKMCVAIPFLREKGYDAIADVVNDGCEQILFLRQEMARAELSGLGLAAEAIRDTPSANT